MPPVPTFPLLSHIENIWTGSILLVVLTHSSTGVVLGLKELVHQLRISVPKCNINSNKRYQVSRAPLLTSFLANNNTPKHIHQ